MHKIWDYLTAVLGPRIIELFRLVTCVRPIELLKITHDGRRILNRDLVTLSKHPTSRHAFTCTPVRNRLANGELHGSIL